MPCKIEIKRQLEEDVKDKSESGLVGSIENAKKVEKSVNSLYNAKVVSFNQEGDYINRNITIPDSLVQIYYDNEVKLEQKADLQRKQEGNWDVDEEGDVVPMTDIYYQLTEEAKRIEEPTSVSELLNNLESIKKSIELLNNKILLNTTVSQYYLTETNEERFKSVLEKNDVKTEEINYIVDFIKSNNLYNKKISQVIGLISQEIVLNSKGVKYYNAVLATEANEKLDDYLKEFLGTQLNVDVVDNMVDHYGSPMAVADILNKVIIINNKNLKTLPEETGHFFFELLGNQNALQNDLLKHVESWEGYQNVYEKYKGVYLKMNSKGELVADINKIKREAVGQAIGEGIIRNYKAKEGDQFFSALQKAIDYIKEILSKLGVFNFNSVVDDIAKDILNSDISKIKQVKDEHYKKRTYAETLKDHPEILKIIEDFQELGATLTGSLAYRDQGDLYRPDDELVHDLDFRIYYDVYNGDIKSFLEKVKEKFPNAEPRKRPNGDLMTWTNEKGNTAILLQSGDLLIDLFFYSALNQTEAEKEDKKFSNWYGAFEEKYEMGRPKDMNDILRWSNFKKTNVGDTTKPFVYYQISEKVKPGIQELFESNPELASIGTQEQYSQYLDTIFPDSQVKDVVYHGSPNKEIQSFLSPEKEGYKKQETTTTGVAGIYFSNKKEVADLYQDFKKEGIKGKTYPAVINTKRSLVVGDKATDGFTEGTFGASALWNIQKGVLQGLRKAGIDSIKTGEYASKTSAVGENIEIAVFEPEQIHILGSKEDIEGFKKFVGKEENIVEEITEDVKQTEKEYKEAKAKINEFNKSLKIEPKDLRASQEATKKKLQATKDKFLENGFTEVSENKFVLKTPSYITAKAKQEALDGENAFKEVKKDGEDYIISYNLADTSAKTRQDLQKQGELPFTKIDLDEALNEQNFLDDLADNIFEGLTDEQKQIIKDNLENGDYEINCKI